MKVEVLKTYMVGSEIKNSHFWMPLTTSFEQFKNNIKKSALLLADINGGKASFQERDKKLYVSYLDIPHTNKVDTLYVLA